MAAGRVRKHGGRISFVGYLEDRDAYGPSTIETGQMPGRAAKPAVRPANDQAQSGHGVQARVMTPEKLGVARQMHGSKWGPCPLTAATTARPGGCPWPSSDRLYGRVTNVRFWLTRTAPKIGLRLVEAKNRHLPTRSAL